MIGSKMKEKKKIDIKSLTGGWNLVHHHRVDKYGVARSTGEDVKGKLIYASDGALAVVITKRQTEPLTMKDISCYAGRFTFDGTCVHHHIAVSTRLERIGLTLKRTVTLSGDLLTLRSDPDGDGHFEIAWKREK